ncbi:hypothetical protein TNCV_4748001 [Trichonephila clavipes]|nr:hypothetical protein TNCV_4748001 [Trichonephila clavipes]
MLRSRPCSSPTATNMKNFDVIGCWPVICPIFSQTIWQGSPPSQIRSSKPRYGVIGIMRSESGYILVIRLYSSGCRSDRQAACLNWHAIVDLRRALFVLCSDTRQSEYHPRIFQLPRRPEWNRDFSTHRSQRLSLKNSRPDE